MSNFSCDARNYKYSEVYGTLCPLSKAEYMRGPWVYVGSEDLDGDGTEWDIVRTDDPNIEPLLQWRYTLI